MYFIYSTPYENNLKTAYINVPCQRIIAFMCGVILTSELLVARTFFCIVSKYAELPMSLDDFV